MLGAGRDWVVRLGAQRQFFEGLSSPTKEMCVYPGFFHAVFHECNRHLPIGKAREFIHERFAEQAATPSLLDGDSHGHTKAEHDRLSAPGGRQYAPVRWALKTVGIRLGWRTGFDSGLTLDYVYENRPRGITLLGRLIDRAYLTSIGWRGVRQRRIHLERMLREAIDRVRTDGRQVHLLDIAAGPGRYVLDTVRSRVPQRLCNGHAQRAPNGEHAAGYSSQDAEGEHLECVGRL